MQKPEFLIDCENPRCKKRLPPTRQQLAFIERCVEKGMAVLMLDCPACDSSQPFHLSNPKAPVETGEPEFQLRCPTVTCYGWVCRVQDGETYFWGCGTCSNSWRRRSDLNEDIRQSISGREYRGACYDHDGLNYRASSLEPSNYDDLVRSEWPL